MAGIVGIFASIGEHIPILKKEKFGEACPEGEINKYHYRGTTMLIFTFCILVTTTEWISGTDSIINCLNQGSLPDNVINNYCYIMGTFSVPRHYVDFDTQLGYDVSQTGVGPYIPRQDYIEVKAYYQWVPFMLFLQGVLFYLPHLIFKTFEGGKIRLIIAGLNQWIMDDEERSSKESELAKYIVETRGNHNLWAFKLLLAHTLYLVNVIGNIFFTDCFLGYEFSTYGVSAASFLEQAQERRIDPMAQVFPRVTKCTFRKFGPSGTIQRHDAQCVLPINIINEKIYVFLWFWFCFLSILTILNLIWTFGVTFFKRARKIIIKRKLKLCPRKEHLLSIDVDLIVRTLDCGDWKVVYYLLKNMDALVFAEFCVSLTEELKEEREYNADTIPLKGLLDGSKKQPNKAASDEELLTLKDVKAKEAGEVV